MADMQGDEMSVNLDVIFLVTDLMIYCVLPFNNTIYININITLFCNDLSLELL